MNLLFFEDTDTALLEFSPIPPAETREISEDFYVDLDADGRLVSMTIEHATQRASLGELNFQRIEKTPVGKVLIVFRKCQNFVLENRLTAQHHDVSKFLPAGVLLGK